MTQTREEIEKWAVLSDEEWVALQVPRLVAIRPSYLLYADALQAILKQGCAKFAPLALIEARAKSVPSFAEKILRKRKAYMRPKGTLPVDPLARLTDLCGARVIAQTSDQVQSVCRFIEETFAIDRANSEDVSGRLRPTEFGYRSVHYIVMIDAKRLQDAGVTLTVPPEILGLKAEIQVRTLLEHAWADIGHEMTYKTELRVPDRIHRQFASLAAVLEGVDRQFGALIHGLEEFKSNFGAYHERKEVDAEIARLRIVLSCDLQNVDLAVKIAQLAISAGRHEVALEILAPYVAEGNQGVERVRGVALVEMHWDAPRGKEYLEGRRSLEAACAHRQKDAETLCVLAGSWARDDESKARELFHQAVGVDATAPVALLRYIEFEIAHTSSNTVARLAAPMIHSAIERCRKQIEARVNLPWAWASRALLHLLVEEPYEALEAVAQLIRLCEPAGDASAAEALASPGRLSAAGRALQRTREALKRIACIREKLPGFDWCERAVLLGLAAAVKDGPAADALREFASWGREEPHLAPGDKIVVLAGGCAAEVQSTIDAFKPVLLAACEGLSFTLLGGGTISGMSGLAGDVAQQSAGRVRAFGYLPRFLPRGAQEDLNPERFARRFNSAGSDFSPLEPLQGWTDVLAAGVDPRRVKLLSYAGGRISWIECVLAVALGARVGVIEDATLPDHRQFREPQWQECPNFVQLPMDPMTLRAFLLVDEIPCRRDEFAAAAQKTHEEYIKSAIPREPSLLTWADLPEDLKLSNFHQVAYAENILKTAGLGLRRITDPGKPLLSTTGLLDQAGVERLAEMEHGRWNVERLLLGWRWAEAKDIGRKLSPYLVPWDKLPPEIQEYDLEAIRSLPGKFREVGLEVYRLEQTAPPGEGEESQDLT
jgi:ppGpp synthetase/RelA/SpoT-type nucleotidyltranferase